MKELTRIKIESAIKELETIERRQELCDEILSSSEINGLKISAKLSSILDDAVKKVLEIMELPKEVTVVAVGANWREETVIWSDIDYILYVPSTDGYEGKFSTIYRKNMSILFSVLELSGDPTIWVAGDFRTDDLRNISSMNIDKRLIQGWDILTLNEIQQKVRNECSPIAMAVQHFKVLEEVYRYWNESIRDITIVDFDIKEDRWWLRHLQHVIWSIATLEDTNSRILIEKLKTENSAVYDALNLFLHVRSWLHLKKLNHDTNIDLLRGSDWDDLQAQFGDNIIERIHEARSTVISFERTLLLEKRKNGMKIWDGTTYGPNGLDVDTSSWGNKIEKVIQVLINAQTTWLKISPGFYSELENDAKYHITWPHPKLSDLLLENGNLSPTVRKLERFGIIENLIPKYGKIQHQKFPPSHPHSRLTRSGRIIQELENLERIVWKDFKEQYGNLTPQERAGIRIALLCKDIPDFAEIDKDSYFKQYKILYPELSTSIDLGYKLIKMQNVLFHCAMYDHWHDEEEIKRIADQIDSWVQLDALYIYTCSLRDYWKADRYPKYHWDKTYGLYKALKNELECRDPKALDESRKKIIERKLRLSEEQAVICDKSPPTFLKSRYMMPTEAFMNTMRYLWRVDEGWTPQITFSNNIDNSVKIIVSAKYIDNLLPVILGICHKYKIDICDAESYRFNTNDPLAVVFLEVNTGNQSPLSSLNTKRIEDFKKELGSALLWWNYDWPNARYILAESHPSFVLEKTKTSNTYKLMVTAQNNTPWFLYAITQIIAESGVTINSTSVYTHLRNDSWPLIEDIFILEPQNIEKLKDVLGIEITEWVK